MTPFLPTLVVAFLMTLVYVAAALPWVVAAFVPPERRDDLWRDLRQPLRQPQPGETTKSFS